MFRVVRSFQGVSWKKSQKIKEREQQRVKKHEE